eukprot:GHRR01017331.1.p2 GENE.GHRR01017331.1~~GHRR01017331.1.p2  ORF type:complete len:106 (+),score=4.88 GHRR01017331.1:376-693(+)
MQSFMWQELKELPSLCGGGVVLISKAVVAICVCPLQDAPALNHLTTQSSTMDRLVGQRLGPFTHKRHDCVLVRMSSPPMLQLHMFTAEAAALISLRKKGRPWTIL